jgi:hypothetical protein
VPFEAHGWDLRGSCVASRFARAGTIRWNEFKVFSSKFNVYPLQL